MDEKIARVGSKIRIKFPFEDEISEYIIIPSFIEYTLDSMGGPYYRGHITKKRASDADPIRDLTISDTSPLAKAVLGHKAGTSIKYCLENGVVVTADLIEVVDDREWDEEEFNDSGKIDRLSNRTKYYYYVGDDIEYAELIAEEKNEIIICLKDGTLVKGKKEMVGKTIFIVGDKSGLKT